MSVATSQIVCHVMWVITVQLVLKIINLLIMFASSVISKIVKLVILIVNVLNVMKVLLLLQDHVFLLVHPTVHKVNVISLLVSAQDVLLDILSVLN